MYLMKILISMLENINQSTEELVKFIVCLILQELELTSNKDHHFYKLMLF